MCLGASEDAKRGPIEEKKDQVAVAAASPIAVRLTPSTKTLNLIRLAALRSGEQREGAGVPR
jgi:hypothetical protein